MENRWRIEYRDEAKKELEEVIKKNPDLKGLIIQRLEALEDFPPDKWFELRRHMGHDLFTSDSQIVRISGEAEPKTRTVWINKVSVRRK